MSDEKPRADLRPLYQLPNHALNFLKKLVSAGAEKSDDIIEYSAIKVTQYISLISTALCIVFLPFQILTNKIPDAIVSTISIVILGSFAILNSKKRYRLVYNSMYISGCLLILFGIYTHGAKTGYAILFLVISNTFYLIFAKEEAWKTIIRNGIICLIYVICQTNYRNWFNGIVEKSPDEIFYSNIVNHSIAFIIVGLTTNFAMKVTQQLDVKRKKSLQEIRNLLTNMRQGIILIDDKMKILPGYSQHTENLVNKDHLDQLTINEFWSLSKFSSDFISQLSSVLLSALGENLFIFEANTHLLPKKVEFKNGCIAHIFWEPIVVDGLVQQIMIVLKDITESERIAAEASKKEKKLELISQILDNGSDLFKTNISRSRIYIRNIEEHINKIADTASPEEVKESMKVIFRAIHTIKGNSRIFKLTNLASACHELETWLEAFAGQDLLKVKADLPTLASMLSNIEVIVSGYMEFYQDIFAKKENKSERLNELLKTFIENERKSARNIKNQDSMVANLIDEYNYLTSVGLGELIAVQIDSAKKIAKELDLADEPEVIIDEGSLRFSETYHQVLQEVMNHILRNSVDHGLSNRSKTEASKGRIEIQASPLAKGGALLTFKDNGPGLNLAKIKAKSQSFGLDGFSSDEDIAKCIFLPNLTTKEAITDISGRGVGLDFVAATLRSLGAKIHIKFDGEKDRAGFRKFHFEIEIPDKMLCQRIHNPAKL